MSDSALHKILERSPFSPMTRDKYRRVIDAWLRFAGADPKGWTRKTAQRFYDDAKGRTSVRTANVYIASLRYVSRWYATQEQDPLLDFAIVQIAGTSYEKSATRRALSPAEATRLLETCHKWTLADRRDFVMMVFALETGMRRTSLAGCDLGNIGSHHGYPFIKVPIKGAAGQKTWEVPLSDTCMLALEHWKKSGKLGPVFPQLKRRVANGKLVLDEGAALSSNTIYKVIKARAEEADISNMYPHVLRHTFITWRKVERVPEEMIASITGHAPDVGWKNMSVYVDMAVVGKDARQTTPAWLAQLVSELIKRS